MNRRAARRSLWLLALLGVIGIGLAVESYLELLTAQSGGDTWCNFGEVSNCVKAFQSKYSRLWGLPISVYGGVCYFLVAAIAVLGLVNRGPFIPASLFHLGLFSFLLTGATGYFAWALFTQVKTLCILCIGDYTVNLSIAGVSWYGCWKQNLPYRSLIRWDLREAFGTPKNVFRTALMVVLFVVLGFVVVHQEKRYYLFQRGLTRAIDGTLPRIATPWARAFPTEGPDDAPIQVVMFGDYSCPYCGMMKRVVNEIMNEYPGLIRLTAIAAPSNSDCSTLAPNNTGHPFACQSVYLSLEILKKKGLDTFWQVHDDLYKIGPAINQSAVLDLGRKYGLTKKELDGILKKSKSPKGLELYNQTAKVVGVGVLPMILLDGFKIAGYNEKWAVLRIIEAELKRKGLRLSDFKRKSVSNSG